MTGHFVGTATFGAGEANATVLGTAGVQDIFVAKYAPDGILLWATSAGGATNDIGAGIATDPRGNSYVTGYFGGTATFGAREANETVLESVGGQDAFVAKYDRNGRLVWVTSAGASGAGVGGRAIATDPRGNSYVTGSSSGATTFGAGEANATVLEVAAGSAIPVDMFVAKYAPAGTLLWATSAGGNSFDMGFGIATDPRGNSYVTGWVDNTFTGGAATFGAGEANETVLDTPGNIMFVAKYARDGTLLWATSSSGSAFGIGIATDPRGNSYVTGSSSGATFGAGEANETVLEGGGVFVAKYRP